MAKIVLLSSDMINKIAAGEVIERPANVVKELVENSIDAGSKKIFIDIKNAGKSFIRVEDDGCGMTREDAIMSLKKHATSKIRNVDDLFNILTFGFRGEALSSVSSVSKFEMITSTGSECTRITYDNSVHVEDCHAEKGTTITVKDLFYNIPARKKYLKTNNVEFKHIIDFVMRYALVYPDIYFKLSHNGKVVLNAVKVNSLREKISLVFGQSYAKNVIETNFDEQGISVKGVISNKNLTRKSKEDIYIFVNKRPIKSQVVEQAIKEAYGTYLMRQEWPFVVLNISIPPTEIDVNVHPRKEEIKFVSDEKVFGAVFSAVKLALTESKQFRTFSYADSFNHRTTGNSSSGDQNLDEFSFGEKDAMAGERSESYHPLPKNIDPKLAAIIEKVRNKNFENVKSYQKQTSEPTKDFDDNHSDEDSIKWPEFLKLNYLGQFYNTYLVFTSRYDLWLFDQHLVEERYNYEQLKFKKIVSQNLLSPVTINLSQKDFLLIKDSLEFFTHSGFDIELFGESGVVIRAVPSIIKTMDVKEKERIIKDIVDEFSVIKRTKKLDEIQDEMIKSVACKASVKAGKVLNPYTVKYMIKNLATCKDPFTCPHGRPVIVKFNVNQIHKMFKRL